MCRLKCYLGKSNDDGEETHKGCRKHNWFCKKCRPSKNRNLQNELRVIFTTQRMPTAAESFPLNAYSSNHSSLPACEGRIQVAQRQLVRPECKLQLRPLISSISKMAAVIFKRWIKNLK